MPSLRLRDLALLAACCAVLSAFPLLINRTLTTHEAVHCQNVREMRADGDWVIPHYGGRPWLERPPLPFWLTIPLTQFLGDHAVTFRLASALVGLGCVLLVGWVASLWYGRAVGLLSGVALATLRQFCHYAAGPEAEIFLCGMVTACVAVFVYLEFRLRPAEGERLLVGQRPWALLAFFALLGLTNLVKGLFFGDAFVLLPAAAFLLWGERPLAMVRRYVWLPGWLVFVVLGGAWATAAYFRQRDVVDLWFSDYGGRLNQGFMREPAYYYLLHLPWALFPWTALAFGGLAMTWRQALTQGRTPERFLWCWALLPLVFLSIPQGKHQHYLLPAIAPWAILGALAAVRLWRRVCDRWQTASTPRGAWIAAASLFALLAAVSWGLHVQPRLLHDRYAADRDFVRDVKDRVPAEATLLVLDDWGPLDASWLLFYLDGRARLLHNVTFLRIERLAGPADGREVYVVARRRHASGLATLGRSDRLFESEHSRGEPKDTTDYRLGLYRLRLTAPPYTGEVRISPMQATGRAPSPWLWPPENDPR
jgi:4-amino-4-deoxy-L-arabinose transferase-like glycosyltransferase